MLDLNHMYSKHLGWARRLGPSIRAGKDCIRAGEDWVGPELGHCAYKLAYATTVSRALLFFSHKMGERFCFLSRVSLPKFWAPGSKAPKKRLPRASASTDLGPRSSELGQVFVLWGQAGLHELEIARAPKASEVLFFAVGFFKEKSKGLGRPQI